MPATKEQLALLATVTRGQPAVVGPYAERCPTHGLRKVWVVLTVAASGEHTERRFDSWPEARRFAAAGRVRLVRQPTTLQHAFEAWLDEKAQGRAWSDKTCRRTGADVADFVGAGDTPLTNVDRDYLLAWVRQLVDRVSLASCKSRFAAVSEFLAWCVIDGYLSENPVNRIKPKVHLPWCNQRGRREMGHGKLQLSESECRDYLAQARRFSTPEERVAAALPLLTGIASGELLHLRARDVDVRAKRISIRDDRQHRDGWRPKTDSRVGELDIEDADLLRDLAWMVAERESADYLFASRRRPGWPLAEDWLWRRVRQCCEDAKVTVVCPHGLRGTYATMLQILARKRAPDIALLLRHGDEGQTARRHYMAAPESRPSLRMVRDEAKRADAA